MSGEVGVDRVNNVVTLTIDRVDKKNALSDRMYGILADAIEEIGNDPAARAILLRAEGPVFSAGTDVADFAAAVATGSPLPENGFRFMRAIAQCPRPVVAAVQGRAIGIGATILLHCDYVVMAEGSQLMTPFVSLALLPEAASTLLLPQRLGHLRAFQMLGLGRPVTADVALAWGLASEVVAADMLDETARAAAERLAAQPAGALMATKQLMRDVDAITRRIETERSALFEQLRSSEAAEVFRAASRS